MPGQTMLRALILMLLAADPSMSTSANAQSRPLGTPLPEGSFSRLETGTPEAAFAGGPIRLSPTADRILRARFSGDKVPIVPDPFRQQLDAAFIARDWSRVMARKADLGASRGKVAMLMWEQTRFLTNGSLWLAELQARDLAASGFQGTDGLAVMMWFYAVAVTLTDGHQCEGQGARDAHLAYLRSAAFEPVLTLVRTLPEAQLATQRDTAIQLEAAFAPERAEDTVCRTANRSPALRAADEWRPDAARTREFLLKHVNAFCSLIRPKPAPPAPTSIAGPVAAPQRR
ncbi:MAG: hypothetical protein U1E70_00670 [Acetobacteraceae bacterium]|nr:hypothetical protein [Pseudomonadota bacterium]